jgi:hypothetical protein
VDVSIVLTFHREGDIALPTLRAVDLCRAEAARADLRVELIAVLDTADERTRELVKSHCGALADVRVLEVEVGDLGLARNAAFAVARGEYGCTMDGDDLMSSNWIQAAHRCAQSSIAPVIVHPDYVIEFGAGRGVTRLKAMEAGSGLAAALLVTHPWTSAAFAPLAAYRDVPYAGSTGRCVGFGFEDWHWNVEQIARGRAHVTAPQTMLLYRKRPGSLLARQASQGRLLAPASFFSPAVFLPIAGRATSGAMDAANAVRSKLATSVLSRLKSRWSASRVAAEDPRFLPPQWMLAGLHRLKSLDAAVPSTVEELADWKYWEPQLRVAAGLEYARALRSSAGVGAGSKVGVCCSQDGLAAEVAAVCDIVFRLDESEAAVLPARSGRPPITVLARGTAGLTDSELDLVLARLLLQLHPRQAIFEPSTRLEEFLTLYGAGLRSAGVEPRVASIPLRGNASVH